MQMNRRTAVRNGLAQIFSKNNLLVQLALLGVIFLTSLYSLYSLKLFVDVYNISTFKLSIVQGLFLVWNAVNDPLMGYLQDVGCGITWIMDRKKVMMYAGPVWALVTLIFWFPVSTSNDTLVALHYLVALFTYDTLMTLVASAYCGICVEVGGDHKGRVNIVILGEIFAIIAGIVIFPIDHFSGNMQDMRLFQICATVICLTAGGLMAFAGHFLETPNKSIATSEDVQLDEEKRSSSPSPLEDTDNLLNALGISWQIVKQPRFLCLIASYFFRALRSIACDQFLIIFVQSLLSRNGFLPLGSVELTVFYILARTLGRLLFLFLFYPVHRHGAHPTLLGLNAIALVLSIVMLLVGRSVYGALAAIFFSRIVHIYSILGRCGAHGLYLIVCGEVIDTDQALHKRSSPLSTLVFTIKALFNKPAEQLAPILGMQLLDLGGYSRNKMHCGAIMARTTSDTFLSTASLSNSTTRIFSESPSSVAIAPSECESLFDSMFRVLVWWPLVCIIGESLFVVLDLYFKRRLAPLVKHSNSRHSDRRFSIQSFEDLTSPT